MELLLPNGPRRHGLSRLYRSVKSAIFSIRDTGLPRQHRPIRQYSCGFKRYARRSANVSLSNAAAFMRLNWRCCERERNTTRASPNALNPVNLTLIPRYG